MGSVPAGGAARGLMLVVAAAVLWGTVGISFKLIATGSATNALSIGFFRLALSVPFLLLAARLLAGSWLPSPHGRAIAALCLFGAMMALYQVCYVLAIERVGVAVAVLVTICSAPVMVALISATLLGEPLHRATALALVMAVAGTALLVGVPEAGTGEMDRLAGGILLALGAALSYALVVLAGRALAPRWHPLHSAGLGFALGALILLPAALAMGFVTEYPVRSWALLLYLGMVPTALAYGIFLASLRATGATAAAIATLLEPLTSTVLAILLLGERLGAWGIAGGALLLGAIVILHRTERPAAPLPG